MNRRARASRARKVVHLRRLELESIPRKPFHASRAGLLRSAAVAVCTAAALRRTDCVRCSHDVAACKEKAQSPNPEPLPSIVSQVPRSQIPKSQSPSTNRQIPKSQAKLNKSGEVMNLMENQLLLTKKVSGSDSLLLKFLWNFLGL